MSKGSSNFVPKPDQVYCLPCAVDMKKSWQKQHDAGIPDHEVLVTPPNNVYTWQPTIQQGIAVVVPVCLVHFQVPKDASGLIH
jgi:hypothetical protein